MNVNTVTTAHQIRWKLMAKRVKVILIFLAYAQVIIPNWMLGRKTNFASSDVTKRGCTMVARDAVTRPRLPLYHPYVFDYFQTQ